MHKAMQELMALGVPCIDHGDPGRQWDAHFIISAELAGNDDEYVADYYHECVREYVDTNGEIQNAFGIVTKVHDVLKAHGLFASWHDAGTICVYDA